MYIFIYSSVCLSISVYISPLFKQHRWNKIKCIILQMFFNSRFNIHNLNLNCAMEPKLHQQRGCCEKGASNHGGGGVRERFINPLLPLVLSFFSLLVKGRLSQDTLMKFKNEHPLTTWSLHG